MEKRIVTPVNIVEDTEVEYSLRPLKLKEYIGQRKVKEKLDIFIRAAKNRSEALDHVVDELVFDILDAEGLKSKEEVVKRLKDKY